VGKDGVRYNCTAAQRERRGRQRSEGVGPGRRTWRKASDRVANGWRATAVDDSVVRRGWRQRRLGAARAARRVCDATVAWADSAGPRALAGGTDEMAIGQVAHNGDWTSKCQCAIEQRQGKGKGEEGGGLGRRRRRKGGPRAGTATG
jgi:hypothetical protein